MKRWNQNGTSHAKRRMGELRSTKLQHEKSELIARWYERHPNADRFAWWRAAQADGLTHNDGTLTADEHTKRVICWLRTTTGAEATS